MILNSGKSEVCLCHVIVAVKNVPRQMRLNVQENNRIKNAKINRFELIHTVTYTIVFNFFSLILAVRMIVAYFILKYSNYEVTIQKNVHYSIHYFNWITVCN